MEGLACWLQSECSIAPACHVDENTKSIASGSASRLRTKKSNLKYTFIVVTCTYVREYAVIFRNHGYKNIKLIKMKGEREQLPSDILI